MLCTELRYDAMECSVLSDCIVIRDALCMAYSRQRVASATGPTLCSYHTLRSNPMLLPHTA
eukprot:3174129-Rhodomonas_salina.1